MPWSMCTATELRAVICVRMQGREWMQGWLQSNFQGSLICLFHVYSWRTMTEGYDSILKLSACDLIVRISEAHNEETYCGCLTVSILMQAPETNRTSSKEKIKIRWWRGTSMKMEEARDGPFTAPSATGRYTDDVRQTWGGLFFCTWRRPVMSQAKVMLEEEQWEKLL